MPAEDRRIAHRDVVLVVRAAELEVGECVLPVALDEQLRLTRVARLIQRTTELGESDLDLGVAADRLAAALAEDLAHQVGGPPCDVDEPVVGVGAGAVAGHRSLEQVAEAVQLVAPLQVRPARLLAGAAEAGAEVAVRLLRASDTVRRPPGTGPRARSRPCARSPRPQPRGTCRSPSPRTPARDGPRAACRRRRDRSWRSTPPTRAGARCASASRCRSRADAVPRTRP